MARFVQNTPPHQHRPRSEPGRLEGSAANSRGRTPAERGISHLSGGPLRVQDRLPVGDGEGRGTWRRGKEPNPLRGEGPTPGASLGRKPRCRQAWTLGGAGAHDRAPRPAASWRRRRAGVLGRHPPRGEPKRGGLPGADVGITRPQPLGTVRRD